MLLNLIEFGTEIQEVGKAPGASHNKGGIVGLEDGIDLKVAAEVEDMGHSTREIGADGRLSGQPDRLGALDPSRRNRPPERGHAGGLVGRGDATHAMPKGNGRGALNRLPLAYKG